MATTRRFVHEAGYPLKRRDEMERPDDYCNGTNIIFLSARSYDALKDRACVLAKWLLSEKGRSSALRDICFSLNERRFPHTHRLATAFATVDEAVTSLEAFYKGKQGWEKTVSVGEHNQSRNKLMFFFGGQGMEWFGMGRELVLKEAVVSDTISEIDRTLRELGETWNLKEELLAPEELSKINEMVIGQVATFSVQFAIARLLISWGVHPSAVVGQSFGEYAASCIAGALTLKETLKLILMRAKLLSECPENGTVAALGMSAENAQSLLEELKLDTTISIASYHHANCVSVAGERQSIDYLGNYLTHNGVQVFWRVFNLTLAYHSSYLDPIEKSFKASAEKKHLRPKETSIPFYSMTEGNAISGRQLDGSYWWRNVRDTVKFHRAIQCAFNDGYRTFVDISVQPLMSYNVKEIGAQESLADDDKPMVFLTLPRKTVKEQHKAFMQNTICSLSAVGYPIQWHRIRGPSPCNAESLPTHS